VRGSGSSFIWRCRRPGWEECGRARISTAPSTVSVTHDRRRGSGLTRRSWATKPGFMNGHWTLWAPSAARQQGRASEWGPRSGKGQRSWGEGGLRRTKDCSSSPRATSGLPSKRDNGVASFVLSVVFSCVVSLVRSLSSGQAGGGAHRADRGSGRERASVDIAMIQTGRTQLMLEQKKEASFRFPVAAMEKKLGPARGFAATFRAPVRCGAAVGAVAIYIRAGDAVRLSISGLRRVTTRVPSALVLRAPKICCASYLVEHCLLGFTSGNSMQIRRFAKKKEKKARKKKPEMGSEANAVCMQKFDGSRVFLDAHTYIGTLLCSLGNTSPRSHSRITLRSRRPSGYAVPAAVYLIT